MLNLIKTESRSVLPWARWPVLSWALRPTLWIVVLLTGCDSEPAAVQLADTSQIDEVRTTNSNILDTRKTRCDDLLSTIETSEMSQKIWNSLQCATFYTELAERENPEVMVVETEPEEPVSTSVQSGDIDFGGALQNISKVLNDSQAPDVSADGEVSLGDESGGD